MVKAKLALAAMAACAVWALVVSVMTGRQRFAPHTTTETLSAQIEGLRAEIAKSEEENIRTAAVISWTLMRRNSMYWTNGAAFEDAVWEFYEKHTPRLLKK